MADATNYLKNEVLDHVLGTGAFTMPATQFIKLHLGAPGADAATAPAVETTRRPADWAVASGGTAALSATVTWTAVSTSETYSHFSIWDADTAGNPLLVGALDAPVAVTAGGDFNLTACPVTLA